MLSRGLNARMPDVRRISARAAGRNRDRLLPMKIFVTLAASAMTLFAAGSVSYVSHDKMNAALVKSATVLTTPELLVQGSFRDKNGRVELHDKETDVLYVIDGEATFVTGGTMVNPKVTASGQTRADEMKGGQSYHLMKGDVIVIPAGTPHWFREVPKSISYYVVKVLR